MRTKVAFDMGAVVNIIHHTRKVPFERPSVCNTLSDRSGHNEP